MKKHSKLIVAAIVALIFIGTLRVPLLEITALSVDIGPSLPAKMGETRKPQLLRVR